MTLLDGIFLFYFTIVVLIVLFMFKQSTQAQGIILRTYKEVAELIGTFRQEMHKAIDIAIDSHVAKYHKS
jgi:hypothetical protein